MDPSSRIIIAGDINQLPVKDFCMQHNLQQLVSKSTRGLRILDIFITNCPCLWKPPSVFEGLVRSDHMAIIANPCVQVKPERKHVYFRDVREHTVERLIWKNVYKNVTGAQFVTLMMWTKRLLY